jgi:hypothetical protein
MDPNFRTRLVKCGGVAVGEPFRQTDAGDALIGEGICTGCCINWLRRELICDKGGVPGNRFDPGEPGGMQTHYKTGKVLQDAFEKESKFVPKYDYAKDLKAGAKYKNSVAQAHNAFHTGSQTQEDLSQTNLVVKQAGEAYKGYLGKPHYENKSRTKQLRHFFADAKADAPELGDVAVVGGVKLATYTGVGEGTGLDNLIDTIGRDDDFGKRRGVVISLKIWFKKTGHSVAIYYGVGNMFYLFDPNLGVYLFRKWEDCKKAFCYSFREGYAPSKDSTDKRDTGNYVVNNEVKGEYFILGWNA